MQFSLLPCTQIPKMTRDFIFLCPLHSESSHVSCLTPTHITLQTYPSGLLKTGFLGEQSSYLFANPRAPLTAPCAPLWLCRFKENRPHERDYNASCLFFSPYFFIYQICASHKTTTKLQKQPWARNREVCFGNLRFLPAGAVRAWWHPNLPLAFSPESLPAGLDFFLLRCILTSQWWGRENFCACRFNQVFFEVSFLIEGSLGQWFSNLMVPKSHRRSMLKQFPMFLPQRYEFSRSGVCEGGKFSCGAAAAGEKNALWEPQLQKRTRRVNWPCSTRNLLVGAHSTYPIWHTQPCATLILPAVALRGSSHSNGLQRKQMSAG